VGACLDALDASLKVGAPVVHPRAVGVLEGHTLTAAELEMAAVEWYGLDLITGHHNELLLPTSHVTVNLEVPHGRLVLKHLYILQSDVVNLRASFVDKLDDPSVICSRKTNVIVPLVGSVYLPVKGH
jgi:hypothetical protein